MSCDAPQLQPQPEPGPRILEFFSGVGGNSLGLRSALHSVAGCDVNPHVVASVEICAHAQLTHAANVNCGPPSAERPACEDTAAVAHSPSPSPEHQASCTNLNKGIETLSPKALDKFGADVWLMSPPCQPFTRQGKQSQGADARCAALAHITHVLLPQVKRKPRLVYVENVHGFEGSAARDALVKALRLVGLTSIVEHLWNPAGDLGAAAQNDATMTWPNSRLRYYMVATAGHSVQVPAGEHGPDPLEEPVPVPPFVASPVRGLTLSDLEQHLPSMQRRSPAGAAVSIGDVIGAWFEAASAVAWRPPVDAVAPHGLLIPARVLCKTGRLFDIVCLSAHRTNCFTKNYGRKVEGAGSIVVSEEQAANLEAAFASHDPTACAAGNGEGDACVCTLQSLGLRYFDPYEVAALLGFPPDFRFPPSLTQRQRWALMGNSVNPLAVAQVLRPFASVIAPAPPPPSAAPSA